MYSWVSWINNWSISTRFFFYPGYSRCQNILLSFTPRRNHYWTASEGMTPPTHSVWGGTLDRILLPLLTNGMKTHDKVQEWSKHSSPRSNLIHIVNIQVCFIDQGIVVRCVSIAEEYMNGSNITLCVFSKPITTQATQVSGEHALIELTPDLCVRHVPEAGGKWKYEIKNEHFWMHGHYVWEIVAFKWSDWINMSVSFLNLNQRKLSISVLTEDH